MTILAEANSRQFAEDKARDLVHQALASLDGTGFPEERMANLRHLSDWALEGHAHG